MEKKLTKKDLQDEARAYEREHGVSYKTAMREVVKKHGGNIPPEWVTWQERNADDLLSLAVVIQQHGAKKYNVNIDIDTAVQAAGLCFAGVLAKDIKDAILDSRDMPYDDSKAKGD